MQNGSTGGFTLTRPGDPRHPIVELLATAHVGTLALYVGDLVTAQAAARVVCEFDERQPDKVRGMHLCMDGAGRFVTTYPEGDKPFYFLDAGSPGQFYFTPGYAAAFLGQMHQLTGEAVYLVSARSLVDFASTSRGVFDTHFSHKLGWGAAVLYRITGEDRYRDIALRVADVLVALQDPDGPWFGARPLHVSLDQTAECALWLRVIPAEIAARA